MGEGVRPDANTPCICVDLRKQLWLNTLRAVVPNRPTFRPTSCPSRYGNIREHCAAIVTTGLGRCCWCGRSSRQSRPGGSARAGRPSIGRSAWCWRSEDPRVCGEAPDAFFAERAAEGPSPRARGDPRAAGDAGAVPGSIPARAGRPAGGRRSAGAAGIHPCRFCVRLPSGRRHPRQFRGPHLRRRCARVCGFSPRLERRVEVAALAWDVGRGLPPCFSVGGYLSPRRVARMFPVRGDRWARQQKACTLHEPFWFGVFSQCIH